VKRVLLTVDLSYQSYRACASHPRLKSMDDVFTGGVYGFLTSVSKIIREAEATDLIVCQDSKPYKRSEIYPEYKQLRRKAADPELLRLHQETMPLLLEMLDELGVPVWGVPGFEYDDLAAHILQRYRNRFDFIYAASNDSDLFQLLGRRNFGIFRTSSKSDIMTGERLSRDFGLTPEQYMLSTALMGTHNDIAGIPGVGQVTAIKAAKDPSMLRRYRDGYADIIERNLRLIKLPHEEFPVDLPMPRRTQEFSPRALYRFCGRLDIDCTKSMHDAFLQTGDRR
jgi:5'-3' exonuclease